MRTVLKKKPNLFSQETNIYYEPFQHITVQPNTDMFSYLAKDFRENKNLTCRKCTAQSTLAQVRICTKYKHWHLPTVG